MPTMLPGRMLFIQASENLDKKFFTSSYCLVQCRVKTIELEAYGENNKASPVQINNTNLGTRLNLYLVTLFKNPRADSPPYIGHVSWLSKKC